MMARSAVLAAAIGVVLISAWLFLGPSVRIIYCDGAAPQWMLDAQDYDGGGCYEELPWWEKPPNAAETMICLGVCVSTEARPSDGR